MRSTPSRKTSNIQGFTLVELLITTALSSVLLVALSSYFGSLVKSDQLQEDSNTLYNQALSISTLWQQTLVHAGDLGCQIFTTRGQIIPVDVNEILTDSGITIYQVGRDFLPNILSYNIQKKLLPQSVVVVTEGMEPPTTTAVYTKETQQFSLSPNNFQKGDSVLLSNCHQAWVFHWPHTAAEKITTPFNITEPNAPYQLGLWRTTLWFAMKDNQNRYGIYRLVLPNENTPEELISDVSAFQANVWSHEHMTPATQDSDWQHITIIELLLTLEKNHQHIFWPTSIALLRKAQFFSIL